MQIVLSCQRLKGCVTAKNIAADFMNL